MQGLVSEPAKKDRGLKSYSNKPDEVRKHRNGSASVACQDDGRARVSRDVLPSMKHRVSVIRASKESEAREARHRRRREWFRLWEVE